MQQEGRHQNEKKKRNKDTLSVGLYACGGCAVRDAMSLLHPFLSHWSDMYFRFLMIYGNELLTDVHTVIANWVLLVY